MSARFVIARFERPFRLAAGFLRLLEIDLAGHVGGLGHHDDLVRADLDEAAHDRERLLRPTLANAKFAHAERRHKRGVVRKDAHLALGPRQDHGIDLVGIRQTLRRHDLQQDGHQQAPWVADRRAGGTGRRAAQRALGAAP